jgi:nitrite reductase/ring-hydroxylating ferredoxin subunit
MPKFMKVATPDELEDQQGKLVELEGQEIALFRVEEAFHALSDTCTHRGGPLSEGTVEGAEVTCPLARGEVRHQDRGCHGAAGGTRSQELPIVQAASCWRTYLR